MNREQRQIKFRAWDGEYMIEWGNLQEVNLEEISLGVIVDSPTDGEQLPIKVMQFTGLVDKNGRDVYEGDVVRGLSYTKEVVMGFVFWNTPFGRWGVTEIGYEPPDIEHLYETLKSEHETEVIGNIYENPELLKEKEQ